MAETYKICPICQTPNHRSAAVCTNCGAGLGHVPLAQDNKAKVGLGRYGEQFGETDLLETNLRWKWGGYLVGGLVTFVVLVCAGTLFLLANRVLESSGLLPDTATPSATFTPLPILTNTPRPTVFLATVTPAPPTVTATFTATITPTVQPCLQQVNPNDDLIQILFRCGHRDLDPIMSIVMELNNLSDPSSIQVGAVIQVPWPTPTLDPNITPSPVLTGADGGAGVAAIAAVVSDFGIRLAPTPTLLPGVMWYQVEPNEDMISIAVEFGANLRVLSDLNPEITFSQCDFGLSFGGPNCLVTVYQGQMMRVPAPTPTPTLHPTASGSETATPTATATYNAPAALSPSERSFFARTDLVTLRWTSSGTLGVNEAYLVNVQDQTSGQTYSAQTTDLFFVIPEAWHGRSAERHDYMWTVSVVDQARPDQARYTTEQRTFTWQG